jgi:hypothetical protein
MKISLCMLVKRKDDEIKGKMSLGELALSVEELSSGNVD